MKSDNDEYPSGHYAVRRGTCPECGTPFSEVPFYECSLHRENHEKEQRIARRTTFEYRARRANSLSDLRELLIEIAGKVGVE